MESIINLQHVSLSFNTQKVFDDISLSINKGEFIAILGPNGAGKSTLLQMVLGLQKIDSGSIDVFGKPAQKGNRHIGYSPQVKPFDRDIPITGKDYIQYGYLLPDNKKQLQERVHDVLMQMDAVDIANKKLGKLSGGEQQRISLAQAIIGEPELLLLDEPLANLDLSYQVELLKRIQDYHKEHNHTVLFVAHDVNPLLPYINRVLYIARGRAILGTIEEVIQEDVLSALYGVQVKVFHVEDRIFVIADDGIVH